MTTRASESSSSKWAATDGPHPSFAPVWDGERVIQRVIRTHTKIQTSRGRSSPHPRGSVPAVTPANCSRSAKEGAQMRSSSSQTPRLGRDRVRIPVPLLPVWRAEVLLQLGRPRKGSLRPDRTPSVLPRWCFTRTVAFVMRFTCPVSRRTTYRWAEQLLNLQAATSKTSAATRRLKTGDKAKPA